MEIRIEVDNRNLSYFAGHNVQGRVIIQNNFQPDNVKQVTILLQGRGSVQWEESGPDRRADVPLGMRVRAKYKEPMVPCLAQEKYVSLLSVLAGDGENSIIIPEGTTTYPFSFFLPTNLPSSFTSYNGQVSYFLRAEVRRSSSSKFDSSAKLYFTVNGVFDLNLQPGATVPKKCTQVKGSNFYVGRRGKLKFVLSLSKRSGFVPGEAIDFKADITNGSNKKVTGVKASLEQVTTFYAQGLTKTRELVVCGVQGPEVGKGEHRIWEGNLLIPAIPPTKLGGSCKIIDMEYYLYLEVNMSGLSSPRYARLPIMIGTIPLRSTFGDFQSAPQRGSGTLPPPSTSQNVQATEPAPVYSEYPDLPPPSYAEAVCSEGFACTPEGNNAEDGNGNGSDHLPTLPSAATPTDDEFVPNYITYNLII